MKNNLLWIFLVICVLIIGFLAGYLVAMQNPGRAILTDNGLRKNSSQAIGSYKSDSWNGGSAALVLKNDGTCLYPTGAYGTWTQENKKIKILLDGASVHTAELVEGGIILHEKFFEKVN